MSAEVSNAIWITLKYCRMFFTSGLLPLYIHILLHTAYGWKGGTLVRTSEGGGVVLSMMVMASEGQTLNLSVGYTIGEANIPRTFRVNYDEDGKLCCLSHAVQTCLVQEEGRKKGWEEG